MYLIENNIKHPEMLDYDVVSIAMMDDPDFVEQLMDTYDYKPELLGNIDNIDTPIIDDTVCGDSIDLLDVEADEYISSYNNIHDGGDGELIDIAIGLNPS